MDDITLRDLRADDEPALFQLHMAVRSEELGMQNWEPELRDRMLRIQFDAQRRSYRERFPHADERLILRDGSPVGWVIVDRSGPKMQCLDIAIVSEERCRGAGTRVFRALQEEATVADRPLALMVLRMNVRAHALYFRLGFRVVAETDLHLMMEWQR